MATELNKADILRTVKEIIKKIKESDPQGINIDTINEVTDIRNLDMDSLDTMEYLFALDEVFGGEIPDDIYRDKKLAVVGNLVEYLITRT